MPVKTHYPSLIGAIILPNVGGWIGGFVTRRNINPWYQSLNRPSWTPPNWAFAPIWTTLYCTMGYASYRVWINGGGFKNAALPLSLYGINLILNWAWTPLFFGLHNLKLALYEIIVLWGSTAAVGVTFFRVDRTAGYLIIPYFVWTTIATALNYVIYRDN
ncbi:translocator protein [Cephus cinctus]|uniref:Translocator protein n=1 Tax=Cephus cinctus TaxID=211228 RepID=A0AAJ7BYB8_CEPCN|nr:translocator protein [Cephus cinctus]